jgi:hypothetical protein
MANVGGALKHFFHVHREACALKVAASASGGRDSGGISVGHLPTCQDETVPTIHRLGSDRAKAGLGYLLDPRC